jgi:hypothetical protein
MRGKSVIALTRHKRNVVRLCFFERSVMQEVNEGKFEISAANAARNSSTLETRRFLSGSAREFRLWRELLQDALRRILATM